ncbi:MAG: T9SS type A sorting domain-containing protein [Bacteroidales bacterium]|nr:T9SS type A sorting domain-containing protein [Bacteroidales bacterium]
MKTTFISLFLSAFALYATAQWQNIAIPGSTAGITSMFTYGEALMAGTAGDGIFTTGDNGNSWTDISGNIGNKNINDIRGGAGPEVIWAATENGIFFTQDHSGYDNNTGTGLTTTDANYYWLGDGNDPNKEWAVGTNGGGVFTSGELGGPWSNANTGISGNGLYVNDLGGYEDDEVVYAVLATEGGVYFSTDQFSSWTLKNNGLSGDALKVKKLTGLGTAVMIATRAGLYWSMDLGDSWTTLIPDEKFNTVGLYLTGSGIICFAFGENGYYTADLLTWNPVALPNLPSGTEVSSFAMNSTHVFIGTNTMGKEGDLTGGIYAAPIDQIITSAEEIFSMPSGNDFLKQNYPNPFSSTTVISYTLPENDFVTLKVYDLPGREVATLVNEFQKAGDYSVQFNASFIRGTTLFYRIKSAKGIIQTKKMTILE